MAGVEFKKYGMTSLTDLGAHFDNDIRSNPKVAHANKTINIAQTKNTPNTT